MSSSESAKGILSTDDEKTVKNKINKYAFSGGQPTTDEHRKKGGNPDIDVAFQYLNYLFEPSDEALKETYNDYKSGKLLTGELKQLAIIKINEFLIEHQKRRAKAKKMLDEFIFKE